MTILLNSRPNPHHPAELWLARQAEGELTPSMTEVITIRTFDNSDRSFFEPSTIFVSSGWSGEYF
jgi:hypothetical protein